MTGSVKVFALYKLTYTQQKKLRKTCPSAYYNKSSKVLEIQTSEWYKVSFNLSNEALFELIAPGVAWKIIVKVDKSSNQFSQNSSIV